MNRPPSRRTLRAAGIVFLLLFLLAGAGTGRAARRSPEYLAAKRSTAACSPTSKAAAAAG